jgi:hypothetical protein
LREQQAREHIVLACLDDHELRLREPNLAQDGFMDGIARLHVRIDDDFFASQPVRGAFEPATALLRFHTREVLRVGMRHTGGNDRRYRMEQFDTGARLMRECARAPNRVGDTRPRIRNRDENPRKFEVRHTLSS